MVRKTKTVSLLFFIMALAAGLISGPIVPAYSQNPGEPDEDEIIDCVRFPEYCEAEETADLIYGYNPPALPPIQESSRRH
jgi:hypothetical protein